MSRVSKQLNKAVKIAKAVDDCTMGVDDGGARNLHELAKSLEPWQVCPDVWKTKAQFFQWMRGQMRRAWSRHPVKVAYMHQHRKRVPLGRITTKNPQGLVWGCQCEHCKQNFKQTECEVDHIDAAGSFKGWEDFEAWMTKLMHINFDSIRVVCKECHRIISYAERMGMTFEEAKLEKQVIAFTKLTVLQQRVVLIDNYSTHPSEITNAKLRRAVYKQILQEQL
jgi:hypothetical protein